jgi:hypothetical protein
MRSIDLNCIAEETDVLKNPCKSTRFNFYPRDRRCSPKCIPENGWQAASHVFKVSMAGLFHHIRLLGLKFIATIEFIGTELASFGPYSCCL